ncbi:type II toxin-antitoxin system YafQ family toxin [Kingella kingae]|uniref:type II toxin-antitoxin system YafQ family toxin n=1 Tax=Kingella kingae TaxID=504 RepID=UPI0002DFB44B|nr:type II toxin-antitoxin system YafQ family toxin [Kingella kingae]MCG9766877.1 type II toxin-antitoxin system YafQ family toxin [Vibrio alginolyticus]MDK4556216.1 type II toxin-antitoxin system YafQ family toxin [Kingella kingae]MDK4577315.1 type II toxin-antitoxin system YafQ family toxin [Kingella kingae]MDK4583332.1 type II toxin-antitoxin system YafQ family toxin [Kingella kingae]MDK4585287.1 type II toxin-antitoxin system YafQ family toxin [Kingella kingae]
MSRTLVPSNQFKRDVKKQWEILLTEEWTDVSWCLIHDEPMAEKYRDHQLTGNLKDYRECHIKPDLLLLYWVEDNEVKLARLGTHSELFR